MKKICQYIGCKKRGDYFWLRVDDGLQGFCYCPEHKKIVLEELSKREVGDPRGWEDKSCRPA